MSADRETEETLPAFFKKPSQASLLALLSHSRLDTLRGWCSQCSVNPCGPRNAKTSFSIPLFHHFWAKYIHYSSLTDEVLREIRKTEAESSPACTHDGLVFSVLASEFPAPFLQKLLYVTRFRLNASIRANRANLKADKLTSELHVDKEIIDDWPQPIGASQALRYCQAYVEATTVTPRKPCVSCGRAFFTTELLSSYSFEFHEESLPSNHPLQVFLFPENRCYPPDTTKVLVPQFLTNYLLYHQYFDIDQVTQRTTLRFCTECQGSMKVAKLPKFALPNNLYRGVLPEDLRDITWVEEKVCALHRVTADVARLQNAETDEKLPYRLVGNTCAHPVNVPSTARVLPRTPSDIHDSLTIVFVGPKFDKTQLPPMFRVRRKVIARFLSFLAANNPLYASVPISACNLALYPDDDVLPSLEESVILNQSTHLSGILSQETASFEQHPLNPVSNSVEAPMERNPTHNVPDITSDAIIESTGVIDFQGNSISGHSATATAIYNLLNPRKSDDEPDLIIPRGGSFVTDYDNPELFPGMFPTLFPCGIGGIEAERTIPISFRQHVNYLLSLHDSCFRFHRFFLFVALSIMKKRQGHLHTAFTVKKAGFQATAEMLSSVTAETLESTARHLEAERPLSELSLEQKTAFSCLKQLNIVSAHIPGSPASKLHDRSAIRGYFGQFGLPHIFLTMNPATAHSPILQVFFGDEMVDLSQRFPSMPIPDVRAKRIAKDPVAAADFFIFCIKTFMKHLLGYDTDTGQSTGGLLGHVNCYYGKCECTMRGCLHGHFEIWLLGGLNPRDIHQKLEHDLPFRQRFFEFWDEIIKHDAPGDDIEISASAEPRVQRPPSIDDPHWDSTFTYDVKLCAETLQRHKCQEVCWKYANVSHIPRELRTCRFHFPHEIVLSSHYDIETKSIVMACRDPTLNYYNPYILSFCRHNHDIKNILSGKSAKAAMFYITNYITKDDLHSHQILSMMSSAITHMKEDSNATPVDRARARLHRWVSLLARLQEVHAQMAVLYIRGFGDTMASHDTVPMLSRVLLMALRSLYPGASPSPLHDAIDNDNDTEEEDDAEETSILVKRSANGSIFTDANQVDDYYYRDDKLSELSFYEFVCCVRKVKGTLSSSQRLGSLARYSLLFPHRQSQSHVLIMHQDPTLPLHRWKLAPRVIGMQVPRKDSSEYPLFMLGHFIPFSHTKPLIPFHMNASSAISSTQFPKFAETVMRNWDDIHECEDERDADRMRRNQNASMAAVHLNAQLAALARGEGTQDEDDEGPLVALDSSKAASSSAMEEMVHTLRSAGWFQPSCKDFPSPDVGVFPTMSKPSVNQRKEWGNTLKAQEQDVRNMRLNSGNAADQLAYSTRFASEIAPPATLASWVTATANPTGTRVIRLPETIATASRPYETSEDIIRRIGQSMTLNKQQWIAYLIVARKFVADTAAATAQEPPSAPLRLLLTGPGGTGKSHVVNALNELMGEYGMGHKLRIVAPTGSAAELVDATTIHRGLGILVKRKKDITGSNGIGFVAAISKQKRLALELEWRPVEWLFCDECSLLGCPLNGELDQMLRLIKGNNTWYGGVNLVLAGDFSQYPPVQQSPLYEPITASTGSKTNADFMKRVGRLAWLSVNAVVELEEQKRMVKDPEYGMTVSRLRMRRCTNEDLELFNTRVVASRDHPEGIELTPEESTVATTIVRDNRSRLYLNILKAKVLVPEKQLVLCAARDFHKGGLPLDGEERDTHLMADFASTIASGSLPSFIPLAVGMNVVLRSRNISPELKIANGSKGVLAALFTSTNGPYHSADGAVVHFPSSPVHLPNLPKGCIYVSPESKAYSVMVAGNRASFRREQLLIEPAYVVTGHFSQGKTIPVVVADLKHGGPAAYVAASRPTSREGLFLLQPLVLKDLNSPPPPPNLLRELDRIEALKHNTLVEHGFLEAPMKQVFCDADEEKERVRFDGQGLQWDTPSSCGKKRKVVDKDVENLTASSAAKRRRLSGNDDLPAKGKHSTIAVRVMLTTSARILTVYIACIKPRRTAGKLASSGALSGKKAASTHGNSAIGFVSARLRL
jgi:Helitron helicase-like domain at N-terminus/PIF1-like helicase